MTLDRESHSAGRIPRAVVSASPLPYNWASKLFSVFPAFDPRL